MNGHLFNWPLWTCIMQQEAKSHTKGTQRVYKFANPQTHTYSSQRQLDMSEEDKKFPTKKKLTWNGI